MKCTLTATHTSHTNKQDLEEATGKLLPSAMAGTRKLLMDTFADSLRYVNGIYSMEFGELECACERYRK